MMSKEEHIAYWESLAATDLETADYNISGEQYVPALFFFHLATEKLLKAHWVKDNAGNTPPFIHDLQKIGVQTLLEWDAEKYDLLGLINTWNIEAHFPDFKQTLRRLATSGFMNIQTAKVKLLHEWLRSCL